MFDFVMRDGRRRDAAAGGSASRSAAHVSLLRVAAVGQTRSSPRSSGRRAPSSDPLEGMDAWIDTYHAIRALDAPGRRRSSSPTAPSARRKRTTCGTSSRTSGATLPRDRVVPFLTSKHSLDFCLSLCRAGVAARVSRRSSCSAATRRVGRPRCVEHAWELRQRDPRARAAPRRSAAGRIRTPMPAQQVDFLLDDSFTAEFYLTQVVSHLDMRAGGAVSRRSAPPRAGPAAGHVRRLLLPQRQPEDAGAC